MAEDLNYDIGLSGWDEFIFVFMGLIPRLLRRELNLVLPSFSQKHPKYPVACCGDFLFYKGWDMDEINSYDLGI